MKQHKFRQCFTKLIVTIMVIVMCLSSTSIASAGLSFNGSSSAGGDGSGTTSASGGYWITSAVANSSNSAVGYRFTLVDAAGNYYVGGESFDLFRESAGSYASKTYHKFSTKYSKTELKKIYTLTEFNTIATTDRCAYDTDYGLELPKLTTGIKSWCGDENLKILLNKIWGTSLKTLKEKRLALLIEPIFPVTLQDQKHALTVTEIAVYGAAKFGADSNGGSSNNSNSWGYISNYTNKHFPNSLYLSTNMCDLIAPTELSKRATFANIIESGYGCAIMSGTNIPNHIRHYAYGFENGEGLNSENTATTELHYSTFFATPDEEYTLGSEPAQGITPPNGFYLKNVSTSAISGEWSSYDLPQTVTQGSENNYFEYNYYPEEYNITYELDGGINHADNPSTYNVLYGVDLKKPTKEGFVFIGWFLDGKKVISINLDSNANHDSVDSLYEMLESRTTGDITLTAKWANFKYYGYIDGILGDNGFKGNDIMSGLHPKGSIATFRQAYLNMQNTGGTIFVVDTVEIDKEMTLASTYYEDADGKVELAEGKSIVIKRYSQPTTVNNGYDVEPHKGVMLKIHNNVTLTLGDIVIDGHSQDDIQNEKIYAPGLTDNEAAIVVEDGGKLIVDGATLQHHYGFLNINPDADIYNQASAVYNAGTFEFKSGLFTKNDAAVNKSIIHNDGTMNMSGGVIEENRSEEDSILANAGELKISGGTISHNYGDGVQVIDEGITKMTGGKISYNSALGVYLVETKSSFELAGGEISFNTKDGVGGHGTFILSGGSVLMNEDDGVQMGSDGIMKMSSGKISGNDSDGVELDKQATLLLSGGEIIGNLERGVHNNGTVNMSGGKISESGDPDKNAAYGDGIYNTGTLTVTGGEVSNNLKTGIQVTAQGTAVITNGKFVNNKYYGVLANSIPSSGLSVTISGGLFAGNDTDGVRVNPSASVSVSGGIFGTDENGIYLGNENGILNFGNISVTGNAIITGNTSNGFYNAAAATINGENVLIYSNGRVTDSGTFIGNGIINYDEGVLEINNAQIYENMENGIENNRGVVEIDGGVIKDNLDSGVWNMAGTVTFNGGTISGNEYCGIYNYNAELYMNGGTISGNTYRYGGGVWLRDETVFEMSGGTISGNTATKTGGGVHNDDSTFNMSGGTITGNTAPNGGGVYNESSDSIEAIFNMTGGTISGNTVTSYGNGVYQDGTFNMSGTAAVDLENDVYLAADRFITVTGELSSNDSVAMITPDSYTLGRTVVRTAFETDGTDTLASDVYEQFDLTPNETYLLRPGDFVDESANILDTDVIISTEYTVEYDANRGIGAPSDQTKYWSEELKLSSIKPTRTDYVFRSWNTELDGTGTTFDVEAAYSDNASTVLYAQWRTFAADGLGYKTIKVGDVVKPDEYLDEFTLPDGKEVASFEVIYNGVPRDGEEKATTVGTGYTIAYKITFTDGTDGEYNLIVTVVDGSIGKWGYIRFISHPYLDTLVENSKWRFGTLNTRLTDTLAIEKPTDDVAQEVWHFTAQDVQDIKAWAQNKSRQEQNAEFGTTFGKCQTKGKYADER